VSNQCLPPQTRQEKNAAFNVLDALLGAEKASSQNRKTSTRQGYAQTGLDKTVDHQFQAPARFDPTKKSSASLRITEVVKEQEAAPTDKEARREKKRKKKEMTTQPEVSKEIEFAVHSRYRSLFPSAGGYEGAITREAMEDRVGKEEEKEGGGFTFGFGKQVL